MIDTIQVSGEESPYALANFHLHNQVQARKLAQASRRICDDILQESRRKSSILKIQFGKCNQWSLF